ncbi:MAG: EAL domain-containing protein, partial [Bacteroidetes bacterium]|nr:EAL domain-containing protein [Bacteroidota bacterium]
MTEAVNYTTKQLSTLAHSRELAIENMLRTLPQSLDYQCNNSDVSQLRDSKYYNKYIRVLGIITTNARCSSSGVDLYSSKLDYIYKKNANGLYIDSTSRGGSEYIVVHKSNKGLLYAILNNAWIDSVLSVLCDGCFSVTVHSNVNNSHASIFKGNKNLSIWGEAVSQQGEYFNALITPTELLSDKISSWYNRYAYLISLLLGGLLLFFIWIVFVFVFVKRPLSYEKLISTALKNNEFVPYYQPIVDSVRNEIIGAEVLVRWVRSDGEIIYPSSFIDYIESNDSMLLTLTTQLINQVCKDKNLITARNQLWFSINIGAKHFMSDDLLNHMKRIKGCSGGICFEITERQPLHNLNIVARYVDALKALGHKIKIDDFGIGYGGFSYLQEINVDAIKIDKIFIDTIGTNNMKILESII